MKVGTGPSKDKDTDGENKGPDFKEEEEDALRASEHGRESSASSKVENGTIGANGVGHSNGQPGGSSISGQGDSADGAGRPPPGLADLSNVEWSYLDPQGQLQGGYSLKIAFDRLPHAVCDIQDLSKQTSCSGGTMRDTSSLPC